MILQDSTTNLQSQEIRKSLKPIFLATWSFGVPHVSYEYKYCLLYSTVISIIYVAMFWTTFDARVRVIRDFRDSMVMFYVISQVATFCGGIGTIVFWILRGARALENTIVNLGALDVELTDLGVEIKHRDVFRTEIRMLGLFLTVWVLIIGIHEFIFDLMGANDNATVFETFCVAYGSHVPHLFMLLAEVTFYTIMFAFTQRFKSINEIFEEISRNQERINDDGKSANERRIMRILQVMKIGQVDSTHRLLSRIERLYKAHQNLCGITEMLSTSFSWQLYLTISITFVNIIYRLVVLYSLVFMHLKGMAVRNILQIAWLIYYNLIFWTIVLSCCHTSAEANRLGIKLYGIVINEEKFHKMLREYSVPISQKKLHFTAGDFFSLDLSLMSTLISYITTYILIAIDLWNNTDKKEVAGSGNVTSEGS